jgi:hypothetical protein
LSCSSLDNSFTCDSGVKDGVMQCWGNKSAAADTLYPLISGTLYRLHQ